MFEYIMILYHSLFRRCICIYVRMHMLTVPTKVFFCVSRKAYICSNNTHSLIIYIHTLLILYIVKYSMQFVGLVFACVNYFRLSYYPQQQI